MTKDPAQRLFADDARSDWVRLETLLLLRWLAIIGQTITVAIAAYFIGLRVELGLCFLAIGASVISNLVAMAIFPRSQRLSDRDAMLTLLFDLTQLGFLLFLTGGLNNPFALLILAPVTISATALTLGSTVMLGGIAIGLITVLAFYHVPLRSLDGSVLQIPPLFLLGFWIAIVIGIVFLSSYARRVTKETHSMNQALLATQMALAREQKLTDLGGVVAAAAHELGTPLATIKLVSSELADDLAEVITSLGGRANVLGHSMGGKAAMVLALTHPDLVHSLTVADIAPVPYTHTQQPYINAMRALDLGALQSRAEAQEALLPLVKDTTLAAFFTQSLDVKAQQWRLNLAALEANMPQILGFPDIDARFSGPALFLTGATSHYVTHAHRPAIKALFPNARFAKIPDAGHWLHAERPRAFEAALRTWLNAAKTA